MVLRFFFNKKILVIIFLSAIDFFLLDSALFCANEIIVLKSGD